MSNNTKTKSMSQKRFASNLVVHIILSVMAIIWVLPLLWVILTSFREEGGSQVNYILPSKVRNRYWRFLPLWKSESIRQGY